MSRFEYYRYTSKETIDVHIVGIKLNVNMSHGIRRTVSWMPCLIDQKTMLIRVNGGSIEPDPCGSGCSIQVCT